LNKVSKTEPIEGLTIPRASNAVQFRTKEGLLVATGYDKVQRDDDGIVRVHFRPGQVCQRNLVKVQPQRPMPSSHFMGEWHPPEPAPDNYSSKDDAKVEFLSTFKVPFAASFGHAWKAAAADLYVNGEPIWVAFQVGMTATPSRRTRYELSKHRKDQT